jgi:hypothetical protein
MWDCVGVGVGDGGLRGLHAGSAHVLVEFLWEALLLFEQLAQLAELLPGSLYLLFKNCSNLPLMINLLVLLLDYLLEERRRLSYLNLRLLLSILIASRKENLMVFCFKCR